MGKTAGRWSWDSLTRIIKSVGQPASALLLTSGGLMLFFPAVRIVGRKDQHCFLPNSLPPLLPPLDLDFSGVPPSLLSSSVLAYAGSATPGRYSTLQLRCACLHIRRPHITHLIAAAHTGNSQRRGPESFKYPTRGICCDWYLRVLFLSCPYRAPVLGQAAPSFLPSFSLPRLKLHYHPYTTPSSSLPLAAAQPHRPTSLSTAAGVH
jgi:hypothetical protein